MSASVVEIRQLIALIEELAEDIAGEYGNDLHGEEAVAWAAEPYPETETYRAIKQRMTTTGHSTNDHPSGCHTRIPS